MAVDWPSVKLGEVVDFLAGYPFRSESYSEDQIGPKLCLGANVAPGSPDWTKLRFWPQHLCSEVEQYLLDHKDIVLAMDRPWIPSGLKIFQFQGTDGPALLVQRVARLRGTDRLDVGFLYGVLRHPAFTNYILRVQTGSTVPHISARQILDYQCLVPPLDEQRRIAAILGALDDKIELNRKMNRTLEELAQSLFKSWFIDFDGHDDLVDSEIGPVPRGWVPGVLSDMLILQRGFDLPASTRTEGPYPVFSAGGFHGTHSDFRVVGPGVVTGRSGKLGDVYFVHTDFWPLNTTLWVKEYRRSGPHHAFHLLRMIDFSQFNAGSAVPTLNRNHVHSLPMVVPPAAVIAEFERTVAPLFKRMWLVTSESRTLTDLRDTLLPKLISGELRAPEAEVLVEAKG